MSRGKPWMPIRSTAWHAIAAVLLAVLPMHGSPAQQPLVGVNGAAHNPAQPPVHLTPSQPPVLNRGSLGGTSFTRPATALLPLGGPAKPAATSINGTTIRPKH